MELNHKALARFTRSNRVLTALEIESAEKVASGFMMILPPGRCRLGQGLNLQLPSFDGRVFRSNRTLTATEKFFWEKIRQGTNRSLPAQKRGRPRLPWSPSGARFSPLTGARFRIPYCRRKRGLMVAEVALSSLPRNGNREKIDQGLLTCSTIELLLH